MIWLASQLHDSQGLAARGLSADHIEHAEIPVRMGKWCSPKPIPLQLIGHWELYSQSDELLLAGDSFDGFLRLEPDGAHLGSWSVSPEIFSIQTHGDAGIRLGSRTYRGRLEVRVLRDKKNLPSKFELILHLPIEDYILGVVCGEMATRSDGGMEALKAQAIAARTYALWRLAGGRQSLSDGPADQRFESVDFETDAAREAIAATWGEVLLWNERLLPAWYHAAPGIRTTNAHDAGFLQKELPPLKGSEEPPEAWENPWTFTVSAERLDALALEKGIGSWVSRIQLLERDPGGRILEARVDGESGSIRLFGEQLRQALGPPSALWDSLQPLADGGLEIRGRGRGHGIGLSQLGALALSRKGLPYSSILAHYYPGAEIVSYHQYPALLP
ncbi:MAG: SpoIID/LytB domain-containing protein [Planctomycetota bacterium]|nr:SpoIID/LytB domain-containing protein [Planctomycetota bacterium]